MDAKPYSPSLPYARYYDISLIDQGYRFNAEQWNSPDIPLAGVFYRNFVYEHVTGWESFEPVLSRAERMLTRQE